MEVGPKNWHNLEAPQVIASLNSSTYGLSREEARKRLKAATDSRVERENMLRADLETVLYRFEDAERRAALYGEGLTPKAEQALNVSMQSFSAGKGSFLDMIDAQRTYLEFELACERAMTDRELALAELESLLGDEFPEAAAGERDRSASK